MKNQKLPKEMEEALKKCPNRPDEKTPACIMNMLGDSDYLTKIFSSQHLTNEICDFVDPTLVDLELDEKTKDDFIYQTFAVKVITKIMGLVDGDTKKSKPLEFYDNNEKIYKLKARDFSKLGDLTKNTQDENADILAAFYGVQDDENYKKLTTWEKRLFADKAISRQDTLLEKK
jgi:hypothetical protein